MLRCSISLWQLLQNMVYLLSGLGGERDLLGFDIDLGLSNNIGSVDSKVDYVLYDKRYIYIEIVARWKNMISLLIPSREYQNAPSLVQ